MKEIILEFFGNFWSLLNSIALFILLGVIIAGVFKLLLPDAFIRKHLGQHNFMANIKAAVLGIPLPLCSCSVIPFVSSLKKSGASNSAVQTFLIATPITGADSIMATYGVFGWLFTIYRVITSVIISLIAGLLTLILVREADSGQQQASQKRESLAVDDHESAEQVAAFKPESVHLNQNNVAQLKSVPNINHSLSVTPIKINIVKAEERMNLVQKVLAHAFDDIYRDIAKSFIIGVIVGALIVTLIPENLVQYISSNPWFNYFLVLALSVPLYVCATASIPLGLSLLSAGFSPGAAFIFLTAGPATNTITISVVLKTMGKQSLLIYLLSVILGSLIFGFVFDNMFIDALGQIKLITEQEEDPGFIAQISSVVLLYLSLKYIINKNARLIKTIGCSGGDCCSLDSKRNNK